MHNTRSNAETCGNSKSYRNPASESCALVDAYLEPTDRQTAAATTCRDCGSVILL